MNTLLNTLWNIQLMEHKLKLFYTIPFYMSRGGGIWARAVCGGAVAHNNKWWDLIA